MKSMKLQEITLKFPEISDDRGVLCISENGSLPFDLKRVFWIYDISEGKTRGGHAHRSCEEVVIALRGSFDMYVDDGKSSKTIRMEHPTKGIYIRKDVWCELRNFAPGTICLVFASEPYNPEGYVNDYNEFLKLCK